MDKDAALKLALEALEFYYDLYKEKGDANAITAIRKVLAQSDQESDDLTAAYMSGVYDGKNKDAPQPEQEPVAMRYDFDGYGWLYIDNGSGSNWKEKIKNAEPLYTAPPQREWVGLTDEEIKSEAKYFCHGWYSENPERLVLLVKTIQAKLREKNGG